MSRARAALVALVLLVGGVVVVAVQGCEECTTTEDCCTEIKPCRMTCNADGLCVADPGM